MLFFVMLPIGHQIYLKRTEKGLTQTQLASLVRIPQSNLCNMEKGKHDPTVSTLRKIAAALEVHPGEFFDDWNDESYKETLTRRKIEKIAAIVTEEIKPADPNEREIA